MHHRNSLRPALLLTALLLAATLLSAQSRQRPTPREHPRAELLTFKDRLWYGGSFGLGFAGGQNFSQFNIGVFPMVGYKVVPWFSIGPRLGLDYNYYKAPGVNPATGAFRSGVSAHVFGFYAGIFARAKIYRWIFAQAEYGVDMGAFPEIDLAGRLRMDDNFKAVKRRINQEQGLVGLGYNSGGQFATEILLLYDLLLPENSFLTPWNYRIGFTYNF
jgi:hypothetical protein